MKMRTVKSFIGLFLAVSILLTLSGCLTLYSCKLKGFEMSEDGKAVYVHYRFKNFGSNAISGYTIYTVVYCQEKTREYGYTIFDRQSFTIPVEPGDDYQRSYYITFKEEDQGRYTVSDVEITETSLTIYK